MRFNSVIYWCFLAVVVAVQWLLPQRFRKGWLLGVSYLFYASWNLPYLALLVGAASLNHFAARWLVQVKDRARRGAVVIGANLLLLALFKYLDWMLGTANNLFALLGLPWTAPIPHWLLPLGISFYLFECMSFIIDVVRNREKPHPFWDFQLFIAFFPKLIAGPILRAKELLPQFKALLPPGAVEIGAAMRTILIGLFLKVVVADGIAPAVDKAFARPVKALGTIDVWMMAIGFGLQIYFDFSSYSRIAIGSARLLGIKLVDNFNHPYVANSPADFWNRWHMSLSRWIRDYLFYPMVGRKTSLGAMCRAALGSMLLCGIWHGAGWTFVSWGLYHGLLVAGYHVITHRGRNQPRPAGPPDAKPWYRTALAVACTFALVQLGWLFFRASTIGQALGLMRTALTPWHMKRALSGTYYAQVSIVALAVLLAPRVSALWERLADRESTERPAWASASLSLGEGLALGMMVVLTLIYLRGQSAFIYFQF